MDPKQEVFKHIPGVDKLLLAEPVRDLLNRYPSGLVKYAIREVLKELRRQAESGKRIPDEPSIVRQISAVVHSLAGRSLKRVINATGVIVHTNLGRAPFSEALLAESFAVLQGYNNLEFNLDTGERGSRNDHLTAKLRYLTGAEDVLVVNNNAAAVMLILRTFARNREVVVSRGELIEIGGSFRLPEIMAVSDCIMKEVGATNKTHLKDYVSALNERTALLFKAHKSNYVIRGFTEEVTLEKLVELGKKHKIPVVYDMGSGLLRKTTLDVLKPEPDVRETLNLGADLVTFSGDKLIGGPQAGIIAGKKKYISALKKEPMTRALRIGKTAIALMESALIHYFNDESLTQKNMIFNSLHQPEESIRLRAERLQGLLEKNGILSQVVTSDGYCGGGALPEEAIPGSAVKLLLPERGKQGKNTPHEKLYHRLLKMDFPVVGVLKKGELHFDVRTVPEEEIGLLAEIIVNAIPETP